MKATASIYGHISADMNSMQQKLQIYVDKGLVHGSAAVPEEPITFEKLDMSKIHSLKRLKAFNGTFFAVDCSTKTLKRANNWGVYLMRAAYATVRNRDVDWGFNERVCTVVGAAHTRRGYLQDFRIEMESQIALDILSKFVHEHDTPDVRSIDVRSTYLLLDGGGYFGGDRKFRINLFEKCKEDGINLLAISKNSPSLHDEKGRDLIATTYMQAPHDIWVYYPVRKADKDKSLYGDIAIVKLCVESPHAFRCDVMEYLTGREVSELISPLTCIAEDPRCVGYPITLLLAHEFSSPSDSMLLSYHDQVEEALRNAGLLDVLRREELSCSFADQLHGIKHAFEWEWWGDQF